MNEENYNDRVLNKNLIDVFLLKFELEKNDLLDFTKIINELSKKFDRTEQIINTNYEVNITDENNAISKTENINYVLINEKFGYKITFSKIENAIWFETSNYIDKNTYIEIMADLINTAKNQNQILISRRIGMRFVNQIPCNSLKQVSKIFNANISKNIIYMGSNEMISRVISQEEYNYEDSKLRLQYGILNKFYPALLKNYDLVLDIDSYDDTRQDSSNWQTVLNSINHKAYSVFIKCLNEKFLQNLK